MRSLNRVLEKYEFHPTRYQMRGKVTFIDTDTGRYALKEKKDHDNEEILKYLKSRNFQYFPEIVSQEDDDILVTKVEDDVPMPPEQKAADLIDLMALLHSKTTHYKEVDISDFKKLYEDISNNIFYLQTYYDDMISVIETHVIMSPSEYLLARNFSQIQGSLYYAKESLEKWYDKVKEKRKQRTVVLHNHLELSHFIRNQNAYLTSWDKSEFGIPIFDFYKFYKKHDLDFEFDELLKRYERNYPLLEEERILLFILMALPDKIEWDDNEYNMCRKISHMIDSIYKTEMIISPYNTKNGKQEEYQK
ncbi:MAG: hypothetical protein KH135_02365 [Firmicutes bacterium]|nr:hypothetical protein [Bacillota bacterium]